MEQEGAADHEWRHDACHIHLATNFVETDLVRCPVQRSGHRSAPSRDLDIADEATVDSFGKEVKRIVREKVERAVADLSTQSAYEQRSTVKTVRNEVDLRAEFERLKSGGKRVDGGRGQYGREGELYELPGGVRVGFRMANDMRTGEKRSVPTLDIRYPDGTWIRFHYNEQR